MRFHAVSTSALQGDYDGMESQFLETDHGRHRRLRAFTHIVNTEYSNSMRCEGETFKVTKDNTSAIQDEDELEVALDRQEHPNQLEITEAVFKIWIKRVYMQNEGSRASRKLQPRIACRTFPFPIEEMASNSEKPYPKCVFELRTFVKELSGQITNEELIGLEIYEIVGRRLVNCIETAEKELLALLDDERQQPITYNHYYTDNVQKARQDESKDLVKQLLRDTAREDINGVFYISNNGSDLERLVMALRKRIVVDMDEQAYVKARAGLSAYYKGAVLVAYTTFS